MNEVYTLECGGARLVFEPTAAGYGYRLEVSHDGQWRAMSAPHNPLVRGASFNLFADAISADSDGSLSLRGTRRLTPAGAEPLEYTWTARVQADPQLGWFHIVVEVDSPRDIPLAMTAGFEPEITVDLGRLPPYERGDHVWFKTGVTNPTSWNDEAFGNDFPATYYYDPYLRLELMLFFDMTAMSWMGFDNIARFLNYRCGFRRRYRPEPAAEVGLYADGFSGQCFPAGRQQFAYWLTANHRGDVPENLSDQEALALLVSRCLALVPAESRWPVNATSWEDFSRNCARELMDTEHCWGRNEHGEFMLNYVDGYSPAWKASLEARGRTFNMYNPCLESAVWAAPALNVVTAVDPAPEYAALLPRMLAFAGPMIREGRSFIGKGRPESKGSLGSWGLVHMLEEALQVARFAGDAEIHRRILRDVTEVLLPAAEKFRHIFPLFFDTATFQKIGTGDGHSINGAYAWLMLELHEITGEARYLDEAVAALRVFYNLPLNAVSQEAFLTAMGTQAAARLHTLTGEAEFAEIYRYLLAQTLRMMYWYSDRTSPHTRDVNVLGMFNAASAISYTALFENIESLARLAPTFKTQGVDPNLLKLYNHARKNNFYLFQRCLPEPYRTSPLNYIPHEDIPLLEGPTAEGRVGQEIYGAGWTFRAYLLWEAYARCADRDVMVLNLDSFEEHRWLRAPEWTLTFVVYNPEPVSKSTLVSFPVAAGRAASLARAPRPGEWTSAALSGSDYSVTLEPFQTVYLRLELAAKVGPGDRPS